MPRPPITKPTMTPGERKAEYSIGPVALGGREVYGEGSCCTLVRWRGIVEEVGLMAGRSIATVRGRARSAIARGTGSRKSREIVRGRSKAMKRRMRIIYIGEGVVWYCCWIFAVWCGLCLRGDGSYAEDFGI